jgi:2-keto-4-pentenoate hydratase/2-oxohepta-3-ene-1,7-dioic acid hydratase in catechol pathway
MRFVRFQPYKGASPRLGLLSDGRIFDLEERAPLPVVAGDMKALLALPDSMRAELAEAALGTHSVPASDTNLLCPLPNPGKFFAQAANYTHGGAKTIPDTATPWLFCKMTDQISGPGDPIVLWEYSPDVIDEIEVALVIGRPGRNIPMERALEHVAGYTICNDVSGRRLDLPKERRRAEFDGFIDWLNGKWMDGFAVLGPAIVTPDELPALNNIDIVGRVNGEVRVKGNTCDLVHTFAQAIAYVSRFLTLRTGDVIATGMPHGPGPEIYLKPGDVVEGEITGLGVLRNPVVSEQSVR